MAKPEDTLIIETTKGRVTVGMRPDLAPNQLPASRSSRARASMTACRSIA